jgi:predicted component of type VI protein secretion system
VTAPLSPVTAPGETVLRSRKGAAMVGGLLVLGLVGAAGLATSLPGRSPVATGSATAPAHQPLVEGAALPQARFGVSSSSGASLGQTAKSTSGLSALPPGTAGQSARIEETGAITLVVPGPRIQADLNRVMAVATGNGGFVASTESQSAMPGSPAQGTVTLDVPEANFDNVLAEIKGFGKVSLLTTNATDVTGQYVDLQARISALQDSRQQYLTIMTKATTIGGILSVQSQLDNLQSQLEQLQGQLQVLNNETTYATLAVTLAQKVVPPPPPKPQPGLAKAWDAAVSGFVAGFEGVVRVAGPLLFALLLLAVVVVAGRWAWRYRPGRSS